jgi:glycosyltransferase involved in cell wall biosynthesis
VSVIVPVYNREDYLGEALRSALGQDYRPFEIVVVDDGSNDATAAVARSFPEVVYVYQPNQGVAAARNSGIGASRGDFIAFLDSDDTWPAQKLSRQIGYHLRHEHIGYSVTHFQNVLEPGFERPAWLRPELLQGDHPGLGTGTLVARRAVFQRVGLFNPLYRIGEDADWLFRAKDAAVPMAIIPEVLLFRRVHRDNLSGQTALVAANLLRTVKDSFQRRRAAG